MRIEYLYQIRMQVYPFLVDIHHAEGTELRRVEVGGFVRDDNLGSPLQSVKFLVE